MRLTRSTGRRNSTAPAPQINAGGSSPGFGHRRLGLAGDDPSSGRIDLAVEHCWIDIELRGRSNLSGTLFSDRPVEATEIATAARELARRMGSMHDFKWTTFMAYGGGFTLGRWDWVLELASEIEDGDASELDLEGVHGIRAIVAAYRGEAEVAMREHAMAVEIAAEATRPEFLASRHSDAGEIAGLMGRLDEAYEEAVAAIGIEPHVFNVKLACRWAIWARDAARARTAAESLDAERVRGEYADAQRTVSRAGVAGLAGDRPAAVAGYRTAIAAFRTLDTPVDLGIALMDFATLLGQGEAEREAADEARAIFVGLGANGLIERLDIGLAGWPDAVDRSVVGFLLDAARSRPRALIGWPRPRASSSCRRTSGDELAVPWSAERRRRPCPRCSPRPPSPSGSCLRPRRG
jgi:hypothetical protein